MNLSQAERILGFDIDLIPIEDKFVDGHVRYYFEASANWEFGCITVKEKTREDACQELVNQIYKARSSYVMKRQRYRCFNCGKIVPLQIHHILQRSKGRDDRLENLVAECGLCHEREHQKKRRISDISVA